MTIEQETSNKEVGRHAHGASLWLIGPLTILVAIIANLIVRAIAFALLPLSGDFFFCNQRRLASSRQLAQQRRWVSMHWFGDSPDDLCKHTSSLQ